MKHPDTATTISIATLLILAAVLLITSQRSHGDELQVIATSHHWNKHPDKTYNEINPGLLYARSVTERISALGGAYKNTLGTASFVLGGQYKHPSGFGAQFGLATGYKEMTGMQITPIGTLFYELPVGLRFSIIPHKEGALGIGFVFRL